jgi:hypothetical protein
MLNWIFSNEGSDKMAKATVRFVVLSVPLIKSNHTEDTCSMDFLPFTETTYTHISRMLSRHNNVVGIPPSKISCFLWPDKDDKALKSTGSIQHPLQEWDELD